MFSKSTECRRGKDQDISGAGQGTGEGENQERDKNCDTAEEESGPGLNQAVGGVALREDVSGGGQETFQERDEDCDNAEEEMDRGLTVAMGGVALSTGGRRGTSWGETQERIHDYVEEDFILAGDVLEGERGTGWGETGEKDDDRDDVEKEKCRGLSQAVDGVARGRRLESSITKVLSVSVPEESAPAEKTDDDLFTPFMEFPPEIASKILMYMDPEDLLKISQTCRLLRSLSENDKLWDVKCKEEGLIYSLNSKDEEVFGRRKSRNTDSFSRWKTNFIKHLRIKANFCQNPIRQPVVIGIGRQYYHLLMQCVEFVGNKIVSANKQTPNMKIWDPLSGICLATLAGHIHTVMVIQVDDPFIISGSGQGSLKVWNSETGECIRTLQGIFGHTDAVFCLHLYGGILVSGSRDRTVRLWNIEERSNPKVFVGHLGAVTCVQFNGKLVASGSLDRTVKIWDSETAENLHTFVHTSVSTKVIFAGIHVVSSSWDEIIRVWDLETGTCMYRLEPVKPMVVCNKVNVMKLHGNLLVSVHPFSTVKIWNTLTWNCLKTLGCASSHEEAVTALDFNDNFVVTGSRDGKVKLWDIKTGQFERFLLVLEGREVREIMMKEAMVVVCATGYNDNGYNDNAEIHVLNFDIY